MKKSLLSAFALTLSASAAFAADLPSRKTAPAYLSPAQPSWTGFYAGLNLGGGWLEDRSNNFGWAWTGNNSNSGGVIGGGQIGYDYQITPLFVVGLEADIQGSSIGDGAANSNWGWNNVWQNGASASLDWFGTVRGRVGVTAFDPNLLVYGTGGFAYGGLSNNGGLLTWSATATGWTAGAGLEYLFLANWSAKIEYLYSEISGGDGGNANWLAAGWNGGNNWRTDTQFHTVRAGVNYHLDFGGAAPLAKY